MLPEFVTKDVVAVLLLVITGKKTYNNKICTCEAEQRHRLQNYMDTSTLIDK